MKNLNKNLVILVSLIALASLAGCNSSDTTTPTPTPTPTPGGTASPQTTTTQLKGCDANGICVKSKIVYGPIRENFTWSGTYIPVVYDGSQDLYRSFRLGNFKAGDQLTFNGNPMWGHIKNFSVTTNGKSNCSDFSTGPIPAQVLVWSGGRAYEVTADSYFEIPVDGTVYWGFNGAQNGVVDYKACVRIDRGDATYRNFTIEVRRCTDTKGVLAACPE